LAEAGLGYQNNPGDTSLLLSNIFGNQATGASQALQGLISGTQNKNTASGTDSLLRSLLQQYLGGSSGGGLPAGTTVGNTLQGMTG